MSKNMKKLRRRSLQKMDSFKSSTWSQTSRSKSHYRKNYEKLVSNNGHQPLFTPTKSFNVFENLKTIQGMPKSRPKSSKSSKISKTPSQTPAHKKYMSRQSISSEESIDDTILVAKKRPFGVNINVSNTDVNFICAPGIPFKTPKNKKIS